MTVLELIEKLKQVSEPEHCKVVISGFDHSYQDISVDIYKITIVGKQMFEYFGDEYLEDNEKVIDAVIIT